MSIKSRTPAQLQLGDIVLYGNKIGVITHLDTDKVMLALNDGTNADAPVSEITIVAKALFVCKELEKQICLQAQL